MRTDALLASFFTGFLVFSLGGCDLFAGPDDPPPSSGDAGSTDADAYSGPTILEVGGADLKGSTFVDLSSGVTTASIIRGPQGGQHIWVMVRYKGDGLWPKKMKVLVTMRIRETGAIVKPGTVPVTQTMVARDGWMQLATAVPAFVKCPCQVFGRVLDVTVEVTDLYGREMQATAPLKGTWDGSCVGVPPGSCAEQ